MSKKIQYGHVMIDLETLGTRADAVILSIGAVKFNLDSGKIDDKAFYASVSIDSNHEAVQRHISESTLLWWFDQSEEARKVFTEPKTTLYAALEDFNSWMDGNIDRERVKVWSNGADFDIPMMAHAFDTNGLAIPWMFYNARCFRTYKALPQASGVLKPQNKCAHNALQDAITQAQWLISIHQKVAA